ncbi:MAG: calcium/sodium antiporter [Firmicutes bacterium]|nr:calcium/sodium antiporter [Bacillota bacterium]
MLIEIVLLLAGFIMLIKGADWFVEGASNIARKFGIPNLVIGLTIVAMGTSAPEAAVSITSALKGNAGITIGNVVGSNILNILIILGITSIISEIRVQRSTIKYEIPFVIFITLVMCFLGVTRGEIILTEGIVLWIIFILYFVYLFRMAKAGGSNAEIKDSDNLEKHKREGNTLKYIIFLVVGGVIIVCGSDIVVDSATDIARIFGISERLIGLTIVALGTSLPELVTSVSAALKGENDIAIGNIIGSNIFNILFIVGTTTVITPVVFSHNFIYDTLISAAAAVLLLIAVERTQSLRRSGGMILIGAYAVYFIYLLY